MTHAVYRCPRCGATEDRKGVLKHSPGCVYPAAPLPPPVFHDDAPGDEMDLQAVPGFDACVNGPKRELERLIRVVGEHRDLRDENERLRDALAQILTCTANYEKAWKLADAALKPGTRT